MESKTLISVIFLFVLLSGTSAASHTLKSKPSPRPCKRLVYYFHDIIYNGKNSKNATSTIVGSPAWGNKTILTKDDHFGDMVVFNDPITLDNNLHSTPIGRAQGFYFYDDRKDAYNGWYGFFCMFNSTQHKGSIHIIGVDPTTVKKRDLSVVGGTGDFFMARGIATYIGDAVEGDVYFRVKVDMKLYECW